MASPKKPFDDLGVAYRVTREQQAFMHRRVGGLTQWSEARRPLIDLLANAYAMGMADAVEVLRPKDQTHG